MILLYVCKIRNRRNFLSTIMARHISTQLTTGTDDELPGVPVVPGTWYQVLPCQCLFMTWIDLLMENKVHHTIISPRRKSNNTGDDKFIFSICVARWVSAWTLMRFPSIHTLESWIPHSIHSARDDKAPSCYAAAHVQWLWCLQTCLWPLNPPTN